MKRLCATLAMMSLAILLFLPVTPSHASDAESLLAKASTTADVLECDPLEVGSTQGDPDDLLGGNGARGNTSGISGGESVDDLSGVDSTWDWILGVLGALSGMVDQ